MGTLAPLPQPMACSNHLQSLQSLLQLQREHPCRMASLRATLTSDAATRKHLPQHLQDAYQRKQPSPRSNAYSSAVAQPEEYYDISHLAEAPQQRSSYGGQLGDGLPETGARQALTEGGLVSEEQVDMLQSLSP